MSLLCTLKNNFRFSQKKSQQQNVSTHRKFIYVFIRNNNDDYVVLMN